MTILVTGSEGFIGSHLVQALLERGHSVKALVLYNSWSSIGWLNEIPVNLRGQLQICFGDVRDRGSLESEIKGCSVVFHLASLIAIPYSYTAPQSYVDTNVTGTLNVLTLCKELGVRVIHTSTSEVYGTAQFTPMTEAHPLVAQSPYAASKIAADQLAYSFHCSYQLPVDIVRPFNTFGPRQSLRAIIPTIICQALSLRDGLIKQLNLGNLSAIRDLNYVDDTVEGFIAVLDNGDCSGKTYNIGSGRPTQISDLVDLVGQVLNVPLPILQNKERFRPEKSEVQALICDSATAFTALQWHPNYSGEEGLLRALYQTVDWFSAHQEYRNLYDTNAYHK